MRKCVVITTINEPGPVCEELAATDYELIVVGDRKTPGAYHDLDLVFLDVEDQRRRFPKLAETLPFNHYARKNLGYLYAIKEGYAIIAETDDDNHPMANWPGIDIGSVHDQVVAPQYPNIYKLFTDEHVWPRGFPLDRIALDEEIELRRDAEANVSVWQGLVNGDPDVDAIFRLTKSPRARDVEFASGRAVTLAKGVLSAFNTQNTVWVDPSMFAYLYLPSHVTFRVTDILKSYVAQFCIWARGGVIGFNGATAVQDRNPHNLLKDFEQELPLYMQFHEMIDALSSISYKGEADDLYTAYQTLAERGLVGGEELDLVELWLEAIGSDA